ncbi:major facilitator superfamily domain-containing protein [Aspergillus karnatakaensis]|uniref:major facilitator superfamily domain-containing protein n=1 Tax=Aspergillus karnatakaensis TaxID=1810916 RepID=UPI003CCDC295
MADQLRQSDDQHQGLGEKQSDNGFPAQNSEVTLSGPSLEQAQKPPVGGPDPPPNGGLLAWLHVAGGFMLFFNTWGMLNTFGVFQTYYESGALFERSSSDISWIGSIQATMLLLVGFFTGPIYDRGHLRPLLVAGGFGIVFGTMMLSLCKEYWQVLLAQGFCVGIGAGCLFVPCVSLLPTYFSTKLGAALGLAVSGSSLGGIIYPIVLNRLIEPVGFGWAVRVIAFIALATLLLPIAIMKQRVTPPKARALIDWSAFTDIRYMTLVVAGLIAFMGLFTLFFYISYVAAARQLTSTNMAFYLVPILNAASCFGRTIPNALADKFGPFNLITPCCAMVGVCILSMIAVTNEAGIIVIAIFSGFFSGALIGLPPLCFVSLTEDKSKIGTRIGMGFGMMAFGVLAGGPGSGDILGGPPNLNWNGVWIFGGVSTLVGAAIFGVLRVTVFGGSLRVKA